MACKDQEESSITATRASTDGNAIYNGELRSPAVIDLFAGVGGLTLGAARAGFQVALAVDLDEQAISSHKRNFPQCRHLKHDIASMDAGDLLKAANLRAHELAGIIGGPPCQGFSIIGRRSAKDPRNDLFHTFFQLVAECRPKFFVAENVLGILHSRNDSIRNRALALVAENYTLLPPLRLKASDYGAPTSRERVLFVGYREESFVPLSPLDFEQRKTRDRIVVSEALRGLPSRIRDNWLTENQSWRAVAPVPDTLFWQKVAGCVPAGAGDPESLQKYKDYRLVSGCFGTRHCTEVRERYRNLKHGEKDQISKSVRLDPDRYCPTLRAGTGLEMGRYQAVRPIHPSAARVITPREAARLQGFPDWFRFDPTKWHSFRQIGNSVSPILAEVVMGLIHERLR